MNLPNKLTILRIILVPFILIFMLPLNYEWLSSWNDFRLNYGVIISLVLFIVASITDYLDGSIARKHGLVSNLGKFLDPIADKLLVISVLIAFVEMGRLSSILPIIFIFRDFIVTGLRLIAAKNNHVIAANYWGKLKTVMQIVAIILVYLDIILLNNISGVSFQIVIQYGANISMALALVLTILSAIIYVRDNKAVLDFAA